MNISDYLKSQSGVAEAQQHRSQNGVGIGSTTTSVTVNKKHLGEHRPTRPVRPFWPSAFFLLAIHFTTATHGLARTRSIEIIPFFSSFFYFRLVKHFTYIYFPFAFLSSIPSFSFFLLHNRNIVLFSFTFYLTFHSLKIFFPNDFSPTNSVIFDILNTTRPICSLTFLVFKSQR